jgi:HEPN domain-containing protein
MSDHERWLKLACEDLGAAKYLIEERKSFYSVACFHSQQASEKFLKAYLVHRNIPFPKTHDLEFLLELIENVNPAITKPLQEIAHLNQYAVRSRYPGEFIEITSEEAIKALSLAERVKTSIESGLR